MLWVLKDDALYRFSLGIAGSIFSPEHLVHPNLINVTWTWIAALVFDNSHVIVPHIDQIHYSIQPKIRNRKEHLRAQADPETAVVRRQSWRNCALIMVSPRVPNRRR
jgi:hypothetical protein